MPEPKVEATEIKATEAPEKSARQAIEDALLEPTEDAAAAEQGKESAGEEQSVEEKIAATSEETQEESTGEDEIDAMLRESEEDTPNVQKRIDKLVSENKAMQAELERLRQVQDAPKKEDKPVYTPQQLRTALKKAMEDGDANLAMDIIEYRNEQLKSEMIKMYNDEKKAAIDQAKAIDGEWQELVTAYDKYADTKVPEIWPGSRKDLSLRDATSLLYQVAMRLYWEDQGVIRAQYKGAGGQKLAVADALTYVLRNKAGSKEGSKVKKLERALIKEKIKKSPVSGVAGGEEKPTRKTLMTDQERLDEVLSERNKYQQERGK
jgi:hypothetical protein